MAEEKNFLEEVLGKLDNLKTLEIRTIIGNFRWNPEHKKIEYQEGRVRMIITQIDLLEGDITTAFSEDFLQEPYDKIREYHAEREKRGQEIIDGNLKAMGQLIKLFLGTVKSRKEAQDLAAEGG